MIHQRWEKCFIIHITEILIKALNKNKSLLPYVVKNLRSIFILNEDGTFKYDSYHRKGCMCEPLKMIDGNLYKLTKRSLERIALSNDTNHAIWGESKIAYIENKCQLFLDVDTPADLEIFKNITEHKL